MRMSSFSEQTKFIDPKIAVHVARKRMLELGFYQVSKSNNNGTTVYMKRNGCFKKVRISDHRDKNPNDDVGFDIVFLENTITADARHRADSIARRYTRKCK